MRRTISALQALFCRVGLCAAMLRALSSIAILVLCIIASGRLARADEGSTISANFNGTPIAGGSYIWFTSVLKPSGLGSQPVTIAAKNGIIQFTANGTNYSLNVPDSYVTFDPGATAATTTFSTTDNSWHTTVPSSGLAGNTLLSAVALPVPQGGLPGGIQQVTWTANFSASAQGVSLQWKWAAAVYNSFSTDYNVLGVKPVDDNQASQYKNSDHAGAPENFKAYVTGGATGGGGSNYTGSYSGTASVPTTADHTSPLIAITSPVSGSYINTKTPHVLVTYSDPVGSGELAASGINTSTLAITLDGIDRTSLFTAGSTSASADIPPSLALTDGLHTLTASLKDQADNASSMAQETFTVDTVPPALTPVVTPAPNASGWNNTSVTVSFVCADATSGIASCPSPVTVATEGLNQIVSATAVDLAGNSTTAAASVNVDKTPPTAIGTQTPSPNASGWNNTPVTISYTCGDALSGVLTCPGPVTISSEGANQLISGDAIDKAGNVTTVQSTVSIDVTAPTLTILSPSDGSTVSSSALTVTGNVSDALSGVASVSCNGAAAALSSGSFSCGLSLVAGANQVMIVATDAAGNQTSNMLNVTLSQSQPLSPPPTLVVITPDTMTMAVGETRQVQLVDDFGRIVPGATWSITDSTVVQISGDPATLVAVAPGQATLAANYQGLAAQAQITVLQGPDLPEGTIRWSVQPIPDPPFFNFGISMIDQSLPTGNNTPDLYDIEGSDGSDIVRAFTNDGRQLWAVQLGSITPAATAASSSTRVVRESNVSLAAPGGPVAEEIALSALAQLADHGLQQGRRRATGRDLQHVSQTGATRQTQALVRRVELMGLRSMRLSAGAAQRALRDWFVSTHGDRHAAAAWLEKLANGGFNAAPTPPSFATRSEVQPESIPPAAAPGDGLPPQSWEITLQTANTNDSGKLLLTLALAFPDSGGVIETISLVKLDPTTGNEVWRYISPGGLDSKWALHPDGTIYVTERLAGYSQVLAFDSLTGQKKFSIPLPTSSETVPACAGNPLSETKAANVGPYMVATDGSVYLDYSVLNWDVTCNPLQGTVLEAHEAISLLNIQPDGSSGATSLKQFDRVGPGGVNYLDVPYFLDSTAPDGTLWVPLYGPGELISDGQGSLLAGWGDFEGYWYDPSIRTATHVIHGSSDYQLPLQNAPSSGMMVLGDNGTAFATDQGTLVSFGINGGGTNWTWTATQGFVDTMYAGTGGTLALNTRQFGSYDTVVRFDATGQPSTDTWTYSNGSDFYSVQDSLADLWFGVNGNNGGLVGVMAQTVSSPQLSDWSITRANLQGARAPTILSNDVVVIGWIDPTRIAFPDASLATPSLVSDLQSKGLRCTAVVLRLAAGNRADISGDNLDVNRQYTNAFLLANSPNGDPGDAIVPGTAERNGDYRIFNHFRVQFEPQDQSGFKNLRFPVATAKVGQTLDPCNTLGLSVKVDAQSHPDNGAKAVASSGLTVFQLNEGRVGTLGQAVNRTLNNCSSQDLVGFCNNPPGPTTPWIYSIIHFDQKGQMQIEKQIFPTYTIYTNGNRALTIAQDPFGLFITLDSSSQVKAADIK